MRFLGEFKIANDPEPQVGIDLPLVRVCEREDIHLIECRDESLGNAVEAHGFVRKPYLGNLLGRRSRNLAKR